MATTYLIKSGGRTELDRTRMAQEGEREAIEDHFRALSSSVATGGPSSGGSPQPDAADSDCAHTTVSIVRHVRWRSAVR